MSESKRCYNMKPSVHYFCVKTKMLADFQICISAPLIPKVLSVEAPHIFIIRILAMPMCFIWIKVFNYFQNVITCEVNC